MIEIDHTALDNTDPTPLEPAKPILASHLLELEKKQRRRFTKQGRDERISTGCTEIDEVLGGGCERGIVVGISAEGGEGRLISLHLLSSILISHLNSPSQSPTKPRATIIDTTSSFPVSLLAKILKSRILSSRAASTTAAVKSANYAVSGQRQAETDDAVEQDVQRCLEMVAISRVFDIEGLWEVLGEVSQDSISQDEERIHKNNPRNHPEANEQSLQKTTEIVDSEEELTPVDALPLPTPTQPRNQVEGFSMELIIINSMTHIISELLARKEKSEAHTLLSLLSLTLHNLTHTSNILTILHNTAVPSKSTYPPTTNPHTRGPQLQTSASIFLSNPTKPALGQIFTQFPELHLFLSSLPKTRQDAELLYGQDEDSLPSQQNTIHYCFVVEVLKDETPNLCFEKGQDKSKVESKEGNKFGWREQRWTAVESTADGINLVGAFQVKRNMRGMGLEREGIGGFTDVGNVAKIWGFGGPRV